MPASSKVWSSKRRLFSSRSATFFFGSRASCSFLRARRSSASLMRRACSRSARNRSSWPPEERCSKRMLRPSSSIRTSALFTSSRKASGFMSPAFTSASAAAAKASEAEASPLAPPGLPPASRARSMCRVYCSFLKFSRRAASVSPWSSTSSSGAVPVPTSCACRVSNSRASVRSKDRMACDVLFLGCAQALPCLPRGTLVPGRSSPGPGPESEAGTGRAVLPKLPVRFWIELGADWTRGRVAELEDAAFELSETVQSSSATADSNPSGGRGQPPAPTAGKRAAATGRRRRRPTTPASPIAKQAGSTRA
mmetsp:Transcript_65729/g.145510  ORF Transcript_65729/g.145510 Transcript_65729/m.145510 type:complete len:309 (+) Transcript_65729:2068-2994(+)